MNPIIIPLTYNYIAAFLTFACNYSCSYCINAYSEIDRKRQLLDGHTWVKALNRIVSRPDLPITLGGGEPTLHPYFYYIVNELHFKGHKLDLLTNLSFNINKFMERVKPNVFKRPAPYASIRVSYHPEMMRRKKDITELIEKVKKMQNAGYHIGVWAVNHPKWYDEIAKFQVMCENEKIDFRLKEFLGIYDDKMYGSYKYLGACNSFCQSCVQCKTSELIIGPEGNIYRCHADLYENRLEIGNILDNEFQIDDVYRSCYYYGSCNPCDLKKKFNRFQNTGHCAVNIIGAKEIDNDDKEQNKY